MRLIMLLAACLVLAACPPVRPPARSFYEVSGSRAERVDAITSMIAEVQTPPTPILDAYFVEEKISDGEFGPSDYRGFYRVAIAPGEVAKWQAILTPLDNTPSYASPSHPYDWWLSENDFATLQFYAPDALTGSLNGWVGIDIKSGQIYIYVFTT